MQHSKWKGNQDIVNKIHFKLYFELHTCSWFLVDKVHFLKCFYLEWCACFPSFVQNSYLHLEKNGFNLKKPNASTYIIMYYLVFLFLFRQYFMLQFSFYYKSNLLMSDIRYIIVGHDVDSCSVCKWYRVGKWKMSMNLKIKSIHWYSWNIIQPYQAH